MIKILFCRCIPFVLYLLPLSLYSQECDQALDSIRSILNDNVQEAMAGYAALPSDSIECPSTYLQIQSDLAFLAYQQTSYQDAYELSKVFIVPPVDVNLLIEHCFYGIWAGQHEAIRRLVGQQSDPRFDFIKGMLLWDVRGTNAADVEAFLSQAFTFIDVYTDRLQYELTIWRAQNLMNSKDQTDMRLARNLLLSLLKRAQSEDYRIAKVWIHYQLGYWARITGDAIAYAEQFEQCLRINDQIQLWPLDHPFRYRILNSLALGLESIGDFPSALQYIVQTIQFFEHRNDALTVAKRQLNLAKVLRQMGRSDEAISLYQQVIPVFEKNGEMENLYSAHNNLGNIHTDRGEYTSALQHAGTALQLKINTVGNKHEHTAISYLNLGQTYLTFSKLPEAEKSLKRALEIFNQLGVKQARNLAGVYLNLGLVYQEQQKWLVAEDAFLQSIRILELSEDMLQKNGDETDLRFISSPLDYIEAHSALARLYALEVATVHNISRADSLYRISLDYLEQIRYRYDNPEAKLELQKKANKIYAELVHMLCSSDVDVHRLYALMELAKAYELKTHLNNETLAQQFKIPLKMMEIERELEAGIDQQVAQLYQQSDPEESRRDSMFNVLNMLKDQRRIFHRKMRSEHPEYYFEKYQSVAPDLNDLQSRLGKEEVVLSFYVLPSKLICLKITHDSAQVWSDSMPDDFPEQCHALIKSITSAARSLPALVEQLTVSHFQFMASILENVPVGSSLIIVPHQVLSTLPFEILLTDALNDIISYRQIPYVMQKFPLRYSYSASIIDKSEYPVGSGSYLGIAPMCCDNDMSASGYKVLTYSKPEVENSAKNWPSAVLLGLEASKSNVLSNLNQFNIYHFATHAIIDPDRPLYGSKLVLSKDPNQISSGLYIHELYHLDLPGQLAVLSACNTGVGQYRSGEGELSLARAFRYAGCPNLLHSKWSVDDRATGYIMEKFFAQLKKGKTISTAIRQAKQQYLSSIPIEAEYRLHPYYWAGFVFTGDQVAISSPWYHKIWPIGIATLVLTIACFAWFVRLRRQRATS